MALACLHHTKRDRSRACCAQQRRHLRKTRMTILIRVDPAPTRAHIISISPAYVEEATYDYFRVPINNFCKIGSSLLCEYV